MERPVRIAVVGSADERLIGELRALPLQPVVRPFATLVGDSEALSRFQPDLVLMALPDEPAEEIGALRLLRQLWPALVVLLVGPAEQELVQAPLARRLGVPLVIHPARPGALASAVEQALAGGERPQPDAFVDLVRGLADEINNPLQLVAGHLQLLRASFANAPERERRDSVQAALRGVERVHNSLERLRLLAQAANGPRSTHPFDLGEALCHAAAARGPEPGPQARLTLPTVALEVPGDAEQLAEAMRALLRFADDLATAGADTELTLTPLPNAARLRLVTRGSLLASWQLPQSFEPYYPTRALRGQSLGLGLFLLQVVVLGHRGQALARRQPDGAVQLDFVLPA